MPQSEIMLRHEILGPIAQGAMGMVYRVSEKDSGRLLALKQLTIEEPSREKELRLKFQQEFHTAARLKHPNIVETFDYTEAVSGPPFFTMEYLPGPGLEALIPVKPEQMLEWLPGLLRGLEFLHTQGFIHADLKPENIRLGSDGALRLIDLGLVTRIGQPSPGIQGTLPYMAPEVIRRAPADRRSDLYSLGAVLFHVLIGEPPFTGDRREVLTGHLERMPTPPSYTDGRCPEKLCRFVMRLLQKDPLHRFQSAGEALAFLNDEEMVIDDATLFHAPMVGRDSEMAELVAAYDRAISNGYEEVFISGDPDADLNALIEEFSCRAQLRGATVLRGAYGSQMAPFEGLRSVFRGLMTLTKSPARAGWQALLARVVPEFGEAAPDESSDPHQELLRLYDASVQLLVDVAAQAPLVICVRDVDQAGPHWLNWLEHVRRNAYNRNIMVVTTQSEAPEWDLEPCRTYLDVEPLTYEASYQVACAILGQSELPEAAIRDAHEVASGLPMRLDNLLRAMVDAGHIIRHNNRWEFIGDVAASDEPEVVLSFEQLKAKRGVSDLAAEVAEALLILGRKTDLLTLWQVLGHYHGVMDLDSTTDIRARSALYDALLELEEARWIENDQGEYALARTFPLREGLAELPETRKLAWHRAIFNTLLGAVAQQSADLGALTEVAKHGLAARDVERAPRSALEAARLHRRFFALDTAESLLREALHLLEHDGSLDASGLLPFYHVRADVAYLSGDWRKAENAYQEALALSREARDAEIETVILNDIGRMRLGAGAYQDADTYFATTLSKLHDEYRHYERVRALTLLGRSSLQQGHLKEASEYVEQALSLARVSGHRALIRDNLAQLGYLHVATGGKREAEGFGLLAEAIALSEQDEAKLELNACYALLGNAHLMLGHFKEALTAFERNSDLCAQIGAAPADEAMAHMRRTQVLLELGDFAGARKTAAPATALARLTGNRILHARVRILEGLAALYMGDFMIYQDAISWTETIVEESGSDELQALWYIAKSEADSYLGQWSAAMSAAGSAIEVLDRGGGHELRDWANILKGEALLNLGLFKPARQALDATGEPRSDALKARLLLVHAKLEQQAGTGVQACQLAQEGLNCARRAGVLSLSAESYLLMARTAPSRSDANRWCRRAVAEAQACEDPLLEAEAFYLASTLAERGNQSDWFLDEAEAAWLRATSGLTSSLRESFASAGERKLLQEAIEARKQGGYRPSSQELQHVLAALQAPPVLDALFDSLLSLLRGERGIDRMVLLIVNSDAHPQVTLGFDERGATITDATLEFARAAQPHQQGWVHALVDPKQAGVAWGHLIVTGLADSQKERAIKLVNCYEGALWAAHQLNRHARDHAEATTN